MGCPWLDVRIRLSEGADHDSVYSQGTGTLPMGPSVTLGTERDQIIFGIVTQLAAPLNMVGLKIGWTSAVLAPPPITLKHLLAQSLVRLRIKP